MATLISNKDCEIIKDVYTSSYEDDDSSDYSYKHEIEDELLCEKYLRELKKKRLTKANKRGIPLSFRRQSVRRGLSEILELKTNEKDVRKFVADKLRLMRYEAKNGYKILNSESQEKILNYRIDFLGNLFGNSDIFFSRRKTIKGQTLPLRKEVTINIIRYYKPRGLFLKDDKDY